MTTTQPKRDNLFKKLREVLGAENAGELIDMLPPHREPLATKADIDRLESGMRTDIDRLDQRMERFEERMEKFEDHLWEFHGALRSQIRTFAAITVTAMLGMGSLIVGAAAVLL